MSDRVLAWWIAASGVGVVGYIAFLAWTGIVIR